MRVLVLDDDPARLRAFKEKHGQDHDICAVETAAEATERLAVGAPWDFVFLDHDLGGEVFVDSAGKNTGMEVVRHICKVHPTIGFVVVHSLNARAGNEMVAKLRDAGYPAKYMPWAWEPHIYDVLNGNGDAVPSLTYTQ